MMPLARIAIAMLLLAFVAIAHAGDDFYHRPPLRWSDIEEPLRLFCDIDDGPEWQQAWPTIERAYLDFLGQDNERRTVDARPLAELYAPIEQGIADERAVRDYYRCWQGHIERCQALERSFLENVAALVPESARVGASAVSRTREIAWASRDGITNTPVMAASTRDVLRGELSKEARTQARDVVALAEAAMLEQLRVVQQAGRELHEAMERQHVRTSKEAAAGADADTAAMAAAVEEAKARADRAIERGGAAFAAVERIGVDALLALLGSWNSEDRRAAVGVLGERGSFLSVKGSIAAKDRRVRWATRRFPPDAKAQESLAAARATWIDALSANVLQQLRDVKADATLVAGHLHDVYDSKPSRWLVAMNEHAQARDDAYQKATEEFHTAVRTALGIPSDYSWPKMRREELDEVDLAVDSGDLSANEVAEMERGLDAFAGEIHDWSHSVPDAASIARLAERLHLGAEEAAQWESFRATLMKNRDGEAKRLTSELDHLRRKRTSSVEDVLAAWRALWAHSEETLEALVTAMRASVHADPQSQAAFEVWGAESRTLPAALVARRSIHGIGSARPTANAIAWRDRAGNPLEALALAGFPPSVRATIDVAIRDVATRFATEARTLDEAELAASLAIDVAISQYQRFFQDGSPTEVRMKAWIELNERRAALVEDVQGPARVRANAAASLREALMGAIDEKQRSLFERAEREALTPGINAERPRFARVFAAAAAITSDDQTRDAVGAATKAWEARWEALSASMASLDDGAAFLALSRNVNLSAAERHGAAVLRWYEVRRREESIVAVRALSRLLGPEERTRLPRW
jgi:hypothetical protein